MAGTQNKWIITSYVCAAFFLWLYCVSHLNLDQRTHICEHLMLQYAVWAQFTILFSLLISILLDFFMVLFFSATLVLFTLELSSILTISSFLICVHAFILVWLEFRDAQSISTMAQRFRSIPYIIIVIEKKFIWPSSTPELQSNR